MKLNRLEFWLMNHPLRGVIQERFEVKTLRRLAAPAAIGTALEIGCGSGRGAGLIRTHFAPARLFAVDLDERMVALARRRNICPDTSFAVMDAARLGFPDGSFDAVFDFGIIHHVPDWRECLAELYRVLAQGGRLYLEEPSVESFQRGPGRVWRALLDHPYDRMFTIPEFKEGLAEAGFAICAFRESNPLRLFRIFSLVAEKAGTPQVFASPCLSAPQRAGLA